MVQDAVGQLIEEDEQLQSRIEHLEVQKSENEEKLRRKQAERERMEQRLMQMKNVSAPYQEEVNSIFQELQGVSSVYLAKFRTLEYLEEELGKIRKFVSACQLWYMRWIMQSAESDLNIISWDLCVQRRRGKNEGRGGETGAIATTH
jgi:predicted nuclease with TOPRIM domain